MIKQAIILAAGSGTRLRPLTYDCPKPLLPIASKPLLVYQLEALAAAGVTDVIIHVAYLSDKIMSTLGDGKQYGLDLDIKYAHSCEPLDTGAGLALSTLMLSDPDKPFISINGKIFTDYNYHSLANIDLVDNIGHMVLVPNPIENPQGDYNIANNHLTKDAHNSSPKFLYTYSGIAVYSEHVTKRLAELLKINNRFSILDIINNNLNKITTSVHHGVWHGLETVEQYNNLNASLTIAEQN